MKKNLKRITGLILAIALLLSNLIVINATDDSWIKGWTGSADSDNYAFNNESPSSIQIESTKANSSKFTDGEDSLIYYAKQVPIDANFIFSATVSIDEYNVMEESSNPQQGSVGIAVLDELFNKTDDKKFTNGIFLGTWAEKSANDLAFHAITRANSDTKTVVETPLSDNIPNTGQNLGSFDLQIKKTDSTYAFICNENSYVIDFNAFNDTIYPTLYIARNAKATFSNVSLEIDTRKLLEIQVLGDLNTSYLCGEDLDLSNVKVIGVYDDKSSEELNDYSVKGFNSNKAGTQTVTLAKGNAKYTFEATVNKIKCTDLTVIYPPAKTEYYKGTSFKTEGLEIEAHYDNGTNEILSPSDYSLSIASTPIKDGDVLNSFSGKQNIKVMRNNTDIIDNAAIQSSFSINVKKDDVSDLQISVIPNKSVYYIDDELDLTGLKVSLIYQDSTTEILDNDEFDIKGFDSSSIGEKTITAIYKNDSSKTAEFKVEVHERSPLGLLITSHPNRTTFSLNEDFDAEGLEVSIIYDNDDLEVTDQYSINTNNFDSSKTGKTSVTILPNNSAFSDINIDATIIEEIPHVWRKAIFGQSANVDKEETGDAFVKADNYGTVDGNVNVRAWSSTGKITADHDGIVYYYTRVDADNNFTISADMTVNKYLEHNNDDTKRNGQEGFGIMARDVVPLLDENDNMTINYSEAKLDSEGVAVPQEKSIVFASNMALVGGYAGTGWPNDPSALTYERNTNINRINLYARDGVDAVDGGGNRIGPFSISENFPKEGSKYRVTLTRINGGVYGKCLDYETGDVRDSYIFNDDLFTMQNDKDLYVGFFASRWADIDFSNIELYETMKDTDPVISNTAVEPKTPDINVISNIYSTNENYKLEIEPYDSKGIVTVKLNDKVVAQDLVLNTTETINIKLDPNAINTVTLSYVPNDNIALTSYDKIIKRVDIYQKDFDTKSDTIYVSADGNFDGDGSKESPYDIDTAVGFIVPGQTILMKEGIYSRNAILEIPETNSGLPDKMKAIVAEDGKEVVFELNKITGGAIVTGDYWKIKGVDFRNSGDNIKAFHLAGSNCIIEDCKFYDNGDMGLQISRNNLSNDIKDWPSNNLIINCESYNNCDPAMINADGFGAKLTVGYGNKFLNCSSHHNVDDGWDLYTKINSGPIGNVTLENCISYKNGYKLLPDGTEEEYTSGGHNGFKIGGENVAVNHVLINCISYGNKANGITTNSNPNLTLKNVIAYDNLGLNFMLYSDKPSEYDYNLQNCVSYRTASGKGFDLLGPVNRNTDYTNNNTNPILNETNYFITSDDEVSRNSSEAVMTQETFNYNLKELENIISSSYTQ